MIKFIVHFKNAVKQMWDALFMMSETMYGEKLRWLGPISFIYGWILLITTLVVWIAFGWKAMLITWVIGLLIGSPSSVIGIRALHQLRKSVEQ